MSDTIKDPDTLDAPAATKAAAEHDAWFREQVEAGRKEAKDAPESCIPLDEVLKELDL